MTRWSYIRRPDTPNQWTYWILCDGTLMAVCESEEQAKKIVEGLNRDEYRNGTK
jgi:hypothetical protein